MMKIIYSLFRVSVAVLVCSVVATLSGGGFNQVFAQDKGTKIKVSDTESLGSKGTIVIQKSDEKLLQAPKVFVESGTDSIVGSPESHLKAAYRSWESSCQRWKAEMKQNNRENLLLASCGEPQKEVETIQSEKTYSYKSKGNYKIRVIGK